MLKHTIIFALAVIAPAGALAKPIKIVCTKEGADYTVIFNPDTSAFVLNPDAEIAAYTVKKVVQSGEDYVVRGVTQAENTRFVARVGKRSQIALFHGKDKFETDTCRSADGSGD